MPDSLVSIIMRTYSQKRLNLLDCAIFSILGSYYKKVEVILVVQTENDIFHSNVANLVYKYVQLGLSINLLRNNTSKDKRAKNLNIGIKESKGRYICFLDDDDVIYPDHLSSLIHILNQSTDIAWAYSDVITTINDFDMNGNIYMLSRGNKFKRIFFSYPELFIDNYIPLHSYIIDCTKVDRELLVFDESMTALEDYAFLLRFAFRYKPQYLPKSTCEYRFFLDGSNTILFGSKSEEKLIEWNDARNKIKSIRDELISSGIFYQYNCYTNVYNTYLKDKGKKEFKVNTIIAVFSKSAFLQFVKSKYPTLWIFLHFIATKTGVIK